MGVMNQMRDKMSIILGIVIVAFLATIFLAGVWASMVPAAKKYYRGSEWDGNYSGTIHVRLKPTDVLL